MPKTRPPLNPGDRVVYSYKTVKNRWYKQPKKNVWIVTDNNPQDITEGSINVHLVRFYHGKKLNNYVMRKNLYRLDLPPVDMSVYRKGNKTNTVVATAKKPKRVNLKLIERRDHPVYVGALARSTFLADLERDMAAAVKRRLPSIPLCPCHGKPQSIVVQHYASHSESRFVCEER